MDFMDMYNDEEKEDVHLRKSWILKSKNENIIVEFKTLYDLINKFDTLEEELKLAKKVELEVAKKVKLKLAEKGELELAEKGELELAEEEELKLAKKVELELAKKGVVLRDWFYLRETINAIFKSLRESSDNKPQPKENLLFEEKFRESILADPSVLLDWRKEVLRNKFERLHQAAISIAAEISKVNKTMNKRRFKSIEGKVECEDSIPKALKSLRGVAKLFLVEKLKLENKPAVARKKPGKPSSGSAVKLRGTALPLIPLFLAWFWQGENYQVLILVFAAAVGLWHAARLGAKLVGKMYYQWTLRSVREPLADKETGPKGQLEKDGLLKVARSQVPSTVSKMPTTERLTERAGEAYAHQFTLAQKFTHYLLRSIIFAPGFEQAGNLKLRLPIEALAGLIAVGLILFRSAVRLWLGTVSDEGVDIDVNHPEIAALLLENGLPDKTALKMAAKKGTPLLKIWIIALNRENKKQFGRTFGIIGGFKMRESQADLYLPAFLLQTVMKGYPKTGNNTLRLLWEKQKYEVSRYFLSLLLKQHATTYQAKIRIDVIVEVLLANLAQKAESLEQNLPTMHKVLNLAGILPRFLRAPVHCYYRRENPKSYLKFALKDLSTPFANRLLDPKNQAHKMYLLYAQVANEATRQLFVNAMMAELKQVMLVNTEPELRASVGSFIMLSSQTPDLRGREIDRWKHQPGGVFGPKIIIPKLMLQKGNSGILGILKIILATLREAPQWKNIAPLRPPVRRGIAGAV